MAFGAGFSGVSAVFSNPVFQSIAGAVLGTAVGYGMTALLQPSPPKMPSIPKTDPVKAIRFDDLYKTPGVQKSKEDELRRARSRSGRAGTILTGPAGLIDEPIIKRNTLLGG